MTGTTTEPEQAAAKRKGRAARAGVPAVGRPSASSALDELTAGRGRIVDIPIADLVPHPDNPRRDLGDLTDLADSIRAHGVRQNLLVVPHEADQARPRYRIVIGHRRTAAAELAGLATLPAVVDTTLSPAQQLELMLLENLQRADLTAIEEADGYQGLLELGLDEAAIAKNIGRSRATVASRLRLVQLPEKARDVVSAHQATLADADLLAETLARPEVVARPELARVLTENFGKTNFAHSVQYELQQVERTIKRATATEELRAAGVTVVDPGQYGDPPRGVKSLSELTNQKAGKGYNAPALTVEEHATCEGHVAWIDNYATTHFGCSGWKAHGHSNRYASTSKPQQTPDERRELLANNKAALAAEVVRRTWIRDDLLRRSKWEADATVYAARHLRSGGHPDYREHAVYEELLGSTGHNGWDGPDPDVEKSGRAIKHLVAAAAARVEAQMPKDFWRGTSRDIAAHLRQLAAWGYTLAEHEQAFVDRVTPKA